MELVEIKSFGCLKTFPKKTIKNEDISLQSKQMERFAGDPPGDSNRSIQMEAGIAVSERR